MSRAGGRCPRACNDAPAGPGGHAGAGDGRDGVAAVDHKGGLVPEFFTGDPVPFPGVISTLGVPFGGYAAFLAGGPKRPGGGSSAGRVRRRLYADAVRPRRGVERASRNPVPPGRPRCPRMVQLGVLAASWGPRTFGARPAAAAAAARGFGRSGRHPPVPQRLRDRRAPGTGSVIGRAPRADTPAGSPAR
jgi:hypothetical protein